MENPENSNTGEEASISDAAVISSLVSRLSDPSLVLDYYQLKVNSAPLREWAELRNIPRETMQDRIDEAKRRLAISYLQDARDALGESPSISDYDELDPPMASRTIKDLFGSWNEAKEEAGLETYPARAPDWAIEGYAETVRISEEECEAAVLEAAEELGRLPKLEEYEDLDIEPSTATIRKRLSPNYRWSEVLERVEFDDDG